MEGSKTKLPIRLDNPRVWRTYIGGKLLDSLHGQPGSEISHFPEEWIMSLVSARNSGREHITDEGMSHVKAGGESLKSVIEADPVRYLGEKHAAAYGADLGVLVKLIDSAERLTVQVHPDRAKAKELFNSSYGKTECWHILGGTTIDGQEPCIYLGFREGITREKWKELFDQQDIKGMLDHMHRFPVKPGDTVLISGGIPHAIGAGCFLVEIQEPTDYTIRIEKTTPSGFRVDDFMCHQGLGFDKMFDCFKYDGCQAEQLRDRWFITPEIKAASQDGVIKSLIGYDSTKMFRLEEINVHGRMTVPSCDCFYGLYVLEGSGAIESGPDRIALEKTAQFFVPAGTGEYSIVSQDAEPLRILRFFGPECDQ